MRTSRLRLLPLLLAVSASLACAQTDAHPAAAAQSAHRDGRHVREVPAAVPPSAYNDHPKLAIILVIDQFRADYLARWRSDFKGRGFDLFLDHGAYFPDCYYDYANTKTAPGHATIGTGAYTDGHGIASNEWWDLARNQKRPISSVEDDRYHLVGVPGAGKPLPGSSPRNLLASTVGDELRLATEGQAKVFGVSLKDRAAILPAGAAANGAFWIDQKSGAFITSTFYMDQLPDWATAFNSGDNIAQAEQEAGVSNPSNFYEQVGATPAANDYELNFAEALIKGEDLGQRNITDMLTISLSANDIMGHANGPDSPQEEQMVDALDGQLDSFFTWLDKNIPGGLGNVWIALTADHGVAPVPETAAQYGLNAARINLDKLIGALNYALNMKFSPGEKIVYVLPHQDLPYLSLNESEFMKAGINEQEAELAVQQALPAAVDSLAPPAAQPAKAQAGTPPAPIQAAAQAAPRQGQSAAPGSSGAGAGRNAQASTAAASTSAPNMSQAAAQAGQANGTAPASPNAMAQPPANRLPPRPVLFRSYTRQQLANGPFPPTQFGELLAHSYSQNGGWYVMVIPAAFQMAAAHGTTHFSPYSYDRHVPLGFYGAPFAPGVYHGRVQPVDIAATYAALLGINQPSASVGHILTEALKPAAEVAYPREPVTRTHKAAAAHGDEAAHHDAAAHHDLAAHHDEAGHPAGAAKETAPAKQAAPAKEAAPAKAKPAPEATPKAATPQADAQPPAKTPPSAAEAKPQ